ncbi:MULTISPECIES: ATP-binding cassette domain-containing protein [Filomicrobium]|uniref:ATP-binding protein n=2 Tax=Filomicrobium TaxID=119044 RepID=A0A0D6J9B1_9HYPH|nr:MULTISPECIES: ATP-binding cassette domain-containing protein [Filomicrobium]CPR14755.1 ATP-binding protein [Candidatus Filomicrobium marinum]SDO76025.1 ABC-type cobalamin/Fe3+-siderophores transport system, ATPase component [Filomicrobium insigne]
MLRVEHLKIPDLPPLTFIVAEGHCLAVEGPSGSGKTRLLRAIADLDPTPGQIFLDGAERGEMPAPRWRSMVRYVAAEPAWWTPTPRQAFPADEGALEKVERAMTSLGLGPELIDRPISQLSTGERQRLALLRALVDEPRVLLLDEPTSALDARHAALVEELIRYQLISNRAVIIVSHDDAQIARLADARLQLGPTNNTKARALRGPQ